MLTELLEIASRAEDEHAAVPGERALLQEPARGRGVGLLDEPRDAKHAIVTLDRLAALDVTVAGRGVIGPDAERREETRARAGCRLQHRDMECLHIADQVIGRQHEHHRIGIGALERERSDRNRRRGIASDRLEDLHARRRVDRAQLLGDEKAVLAVADDRRRLGAGEATQPLDGLLQHGPLGHERQELLGQQLARHRPEPAAAAATEDNGMDRRCHDADRQGNDPSLPQTDRPAGPWRPGA